MTVIHAIMACHNRRDSTLRSLDLLYASAFEAGIEVRVSLFDDGSTDGTATAVRTAHPNVSILCGDGSAYWARGMAMSELDALAAENKDPELRLLWLNDDTSLKPNALQRALCASLDNPSAIIVGATEDPGNGKLTYSALHRSGIHPLRYDRVEPAESLQKITTFNGNFVLVPVAVADKLGGIDSAFSHALADIDYGLRARDHDVASLLLPETIGYCSRPPAGPTRSIPAAWRAFIGVKGGGNPRSLVRFLHRHGGPTWPFFLTATYVKWWVRAIASWIVDSTPVRSRARS